MQFLGSIPVKFTEVDRHYQHLMSLFRVRQVGQERYQDFLRRLEYFVPAAGQNLGGPAGRQGGGFIEGRDLPMRA